MGVEVFLQFSVAAPPKNVSQAVARRRPCTILVIVIKHVLKVLSFLVLFQAISESDGHHFMILFKDGLKFRGIYLHNLDNDQVSFLYTWLLKEV